MKPVFLVTGVLAVIFGVIISYFLIASVIKVGETMEEIQEKSLRLTDIEINKIIGSSLIGGVIVMIGFILIKKSFE